MTRNFILIVVVSLFASVVCRRELEYSNSSDINNCLNAILNNDRARLELYIEKIAISPNSTDDKGRTFLYWAARYSNIQIIEYLLKEGALINKLNLESHETPLMGAAMSGRLNVIEYLIDRGADININNFNNSALIQAAANGQLKVFKFLLVKGADIRSQSTRALELAMQFSSNNLRSSLFFRSSVLSDYNEIIKLLIENGADINAKYAPKKSGIIGWIVETKNYSMMDFLLSVKADINLKDSNGFTPLMYAVNRNDKKMVKLLLKNGADKSLKNNYNEKAIDNAGPEIKAILNK